MTSATRMTVTAQHDTDGNWEIALSGPAAAVVRLIDALDTAARFPESAHLVRELTEDLAAATNLVQPAPPTPATPEPTP